VRGDARRGNATGRKAGKVAKGEPRVRRPVALPDLEPLAEGGFVLRRIVVLSVLLLVAVAPAALAASVKIRVEGKTTTIFGATQPTIAADNALQALDVASFAGEFYYGKTVSTFGEYVSQIGKYAGDQSTGWVFKVNGISPPVGADKVVLKDGDVVLWYHATFGPTGGPRTLELKRLPANCYVVESLNDAGARVRAAGATLTADGKRFRTTAGRACIGKHVGLVRATVPGAVRSNAQK
jgi:hypothetical protein